MCPTYSKYLLYRQLREYKVDMMSQVHRILSITLGEPPSSFDWNYYDKQKVYHSYPDLTPGSFYECHVQVKLEEYVSLINDPRNEYHKLFTVKFLGNIVEGRPIRYVNLPIEKLKHYAQKTLESGEPGKYRKIALSTAKTLHSVVRLRCWKAL
jgi:bleomycin hydrolase